MGSGAILGDLIKSFFKRRIGIKPGEKWIFFDQVDYAIGALLFTSLVYTPSLALILTVIAISFFGNILVNHAAFWLDIRKEKW
jgi:CDP-2,3-bis-(O-geranylgeranyl)-sn-glycerol synthase